MKQSASNPAKAAQVEGSGVVGQEKSLPDYLQPGLNLVFIGVNPGEYSVRRRHYFARSTSRFWPAFSASKLSKAMRSALGLDRLYPEHDAELLRFGIGLTDVVKRSTANITGLDWSDYERDVPMLVEKLMRYRPRIACFHGLTGYRPFLRIAFNNRKSKPMLGEQPEVVGATRLYVVPNPSPANAHFNVAQMTAWYDRLADFIESSSNRLLQ
jgi:double-stranded uracil-DNA glycosylase